MYDLSTAGVINTCKGINNVHVQIPLVNPAIFLIVESTWDVQVGASFNREKVNTL